MGAFLDTLFGRSPGQYDPTGGRRNRLLDQYSGQLQQMEGRPLHETLDPETLKYLEAKAEEETRSAYPGAGRSGWMNDAVSNAKLKVRMAMLQEAIKNRTEMRNMVQGMANQGSQHIPGQTGLLADAGAKLAGRGMQAGADWLFGEGKPKEQPGRGDTSSQGGFSDTLRNREPQQNSDLWY